MTAWLAPRTRELRPNGMAFSIRRLGDGRWELTGTDMSVPVVLPTKQQAIFRAEFMGKDCDRVTLEVNDPDEERYEQPEYWSGDLIDCP